jgi:hypothetical protein
MHLVEILLPLRDEQGRRFPRERYDEVRAELTGRFGGATAHLQSPAEGLWQDAEGEVEHDRIVILEAMVEELDREWWAAYRERLRERFRQEELVVRAYAIDRL